MSLDPAIRDHKAWLGYLQPDGLVVSPAALVDAQVLLNVNAAPLQRRFLDFVEEIEADGKGSATVSSLREVLLQFLEWPEQYVAGLSAGDPIPVALKIPIQNFGETLEPTYAFRDSKATGDEIPWMLLVEELPRGTDFDIAVESAMAGWSATPSRRFERLLREAGVPIGLQSNGTHFRLLYAPRGENTGTLTFKVSDMIEVAGRPILAAFELLLSKYQLLAAPSEARLPALLKKSRDYQARVSTTLAGQVLDALYELLRGFQIAHDHSKGELLREALEQDPDSIYGGLLTTLMRLVFLLYAEDRGLMPGSGLYVQHYAVHGLFERLRNDAERYPDTMDTRYGAWAQLIALFRAVYQGSSYPALKMPARQGHLFDPRRFPFLQGDRGDCPAEPELSPASSPKLPLVSDGVVFRVLQKLLLLKGERLSYRTLDVEQIGSVYETMMGFKLRTATGATIALKPAKKMGAPAPIDLDALAATVPKDRAKRIEEDTDYKLPATMAAAVKAAKSADDLLAALEKRIARNATPQPLPEGAMVLTPTDERRKTGSHYTPRSLTEPIVRTTLEPIFKQLGEHPTPEQLQELKVCDPAMGSGAFLVEACRQLADALVEAWRHHGYKPYIPDDEDEVLYARRLVAQRCLYGVDRNPMAVDLTKLSLWLATLAKDHPFTFLDHALRAGDSLVGLTRKQIAAFDWGGVGQLPSVTQYLAQRIETATEVRRQILAAGDNMPPEAKAQKLKVADEALQPVRMAGDACIAAFFSESKAKARDEARGRLAMDFARFCERIDVEAMRRLDAAIADLKGGEKPITPFHWEIEFPEVFGAETKGFDLIVGNPPFAGKNTLINANRAEYQGWLSALHEHSHGNADLVAHFFRRAFCILRTNGAFGLIATNSIGQGDTRSTGLGHICEEGGGIFAATKRYKWPGEVAVIVSVIHVFKGLYTGPRILNGTPVSRITAFLFHEGSNVNPLSLSENRSKCFIGNYVLGMGFTFDDTAKEGIATSISEMKRLLAQNPKCADVILPYMGGEEVNADPCQHHQRYVINFCDKEELECRENWPELLSILEEKVKPERSKLPPKNSWNKAVSSKWWLFGAWRRELAARTRSLKRILVLSRVRATGFVFVEPKVVCSEQLVVFALSSYAAFTCLQCRTHEIWSHFFSGTALDLIRYAPTDCFETYPFPNGVESNSDIEQVGSKYYVFRADLMVRNNEGLTKTYNRFHDPEETSPDILKLRELHDAMDRAVLDAYGWTDLQPTCEFLLDYEDEDDDEDTGSKRKKKKPWRYRWPDDLRDEVLARLLKLNAERAEEERRTGAAAGKKGGRGSKNLELPLLE